VAKFKVAPGEIVFADTYRYTIQGNKIKFPVRCRIVVTNQRIVYFDMGKMAPFYFQLGFLLQLLVKGRPVSLPLGNLKVSRGKYAKNTKLLLLSTDDGKEVFLDRFEKSFKWFQDTITQNGVGLSQLAEEEWRVSI